MRDLWLQFLMIGPYASNIRFLVNSVAITGPPIKGIDIIFDHNGMRPILVLVI